MSTRLSKSRFQKGLQCEKALWFAVNEPESADPLPESRAWLYEQGTTVGRVAHGLHPGGIEVDEDHLHATQAVETTARLLSDGARILYEPAFFYDGVLVRVDILVAAGDAGGPGRAFDLHEVKSTARLKEQHITDAAVQTYVVEGAGVPVRRTCVVHLDPSYVYAGGDYDLSRLFAVEDVTAQARAFVPLIHGMVERFRHMLEGPEPAIRIGSQCTKPYECDFVGRCHAFLPAEHPVTALPRISEDTLHGLLDQGILGMKDIPDLYVPLSPAQRSTVRVVKSGEPKVDLEGLRGDIARLEYPLYHLDFETLMSAVPLWPGYRPYEAVPFQYSIHVEGRDGTTHHRDYLHNGRDDPRRSLAEHLIADLGDTGSILHYTGYERRILDRLAASLPDLAPSITRVKSRLFDLEAVIRIRTLHPATNGRTSIKCVLPAWRDDVSYSGLDIQDGQAASARYLQTITCDTGDEEREKTFDDLRAYCGTDTLAMVRLLDTLRDLVTAAGA